MATGLGDEPGRSAVALAETGDALHPSARCRGVGDEVVHLAGHSTEKVLAHMDGPGGDGFEREHRIETRDSVDLGRSDVQAATDLRETTAAHVADTIDEGMQRRQECRPGRSVDTIGGAEHPIEGVGLIDGRLIGGNPAVHDSALLHAHGDGLELGGARLGVGEIEREAIHVDIVGGVDAHEHESGAEIVVDVDGHVDRPAP